MNENKKPRLAEILGVKVGQEFRVDIAPFRNNIYRINTYGAFEWKTDHFTCNAWSNDASVKSLQAAINNPSLIRPVTQWTQDDIEDAKAVRRLYPECEWVSRDKVIKANNTTIYVYKSIPEKRSNYFSAETGGVVFSYIPLLDTTLPSVTWENSPVRIADILGDGE